jgi:HNH endonuclease domain protein
VQTNHLKIKTWDYQHTIDYIINKNIKSILEILTLYIEFENWWEGNKEVLFQTVKQKANMIATSMGILNNKYLKRINFELSILEQKYDPANINFELKTFTYLSNTYHYNPNTGSSWRDPSPEKTTFTKKLTPNELMERVEFLSQYNYEMTEYQYECFNQRSLMTVELRNRIIERDQGFCQICGKKCQRSEIEIDHIIPVSKGGKTTLSNLQVLCSKCNRKKSNKILTSLISLTSLTNIKTSKLSAGEKSLTTDEKNLSNKTVERFKPKQYIQIGDTVKILYLEDNFEMYLKLVSTFQNNVQEQVTIDSPVGQALLKHEEGDIININIQGKIDKIKILEVIKN